MRLLDWMLLWWAFWATVAALSYRKDWYDLRDKFQAFLEGQKERLESLDSTLKMVGADGVESEIDLKDYKVQSIKPGYPHSKKDRSEQP
jgi:hypothetical protein